MAVEGIGPVDPVSHLDNLDRAARAAKVEHSDSIEISPEAKSASAMHQANELAQATPDVRADRIAEVSKNLNDPSYINATVLDRLADRIVESFGL